ncbi:hypothetical protein L6452_25179 [Arctium lappa]|uniref:Uncharacterized protein n=1 Tax=Arctium lappa TaxID=4217 RepID=A0ACB9ABL0_ARCLA|nr:hypothetical protein L6452_25179 [Arctium lappa]
MNCYLLMEFRIITHASNAANAMETLREARDTTISDANGDDASASNALAITSQILPSAADQLDLDTIFNQSLSSDSGQLDPNTIMNHLMHNFAGVPYQTDIQSQDFLRNMLDQITQNPEIMNAITQLGQQIDGNQDSGSMFAAMSRCQDGGVSGDLDMSFMVQQMMPFLSQDLHRGGSTSNLLEHDPSMKHENHRRCYSDSASLNGLPMDCQMNLKEAAQKIEEDYPAAEVFSSMVETAALLHENVYDIYGLAELCSEEELAETVSNLEGLSVFLKKNGESISHHNHHYHRYFKVQILYPLL